MSLEAFSEEELKAELDKRQKEKKRQARPVMNENPDLTALKKLIVEVVCTIEDDGFADEDTYKWVYEAVMEMFYGPKFWVWQNSLDEL